MGASIREGKLLYHLTDINNLEAIFDRGLLSRADLDEHRGVFVDVADQDIVIGRRQSGLDSYVPFHFYSPSPFAARVQLDNPESTFVLIAVRRSVAEGGNWLVVPEHPLGGGSPRIMPYSDGMKQMKWNLMEARNYHDQACKNACMAECLSPEAVPASRFLAIYVRDNAAQVRVAELVEHYDLRCHVNLNSRMFVHA